MAFLFIKHRYTHYICVKAYILLILFHFYSLTFTLEKEKFWSLFSSSWGLSQEKVPWFKWLRIASSVLLVLITLMLLWVWRQVPAPPRPLNMHPLLPTGSLQIYISSHLLIKHTFLTEDFLALYDKWHFIFSCELYYPS